MDERYLRFQSKLAAVVAEARGIVETGSSKGFENRLAYRTINKLYEEADLLLDKLEYLSKSAIEGKLYEMDNEKFELITSEGKSITHFSCGSRIEVFDPEENEWHLGRVEHKREGTNQGYYFCCSSMGNPFLYTGMKARIRRDL